MGIPRYDWRDHFSINNVFQFHGEEQDIRFLMDGIEDFLTELSIVSNTAPSIDPFWTEYDNENPEDGDRCDIRFILKNAKKVKKLKINILELDAEPYLVSTLQSFVFPKFKKLENLSISAFLSFENLMKLEELLLKNIEEQKNILQGSNFSKTPEKPMPKIILNIYQD